MIEPTRRAVVAGLAAATLVNPACAQPHQPTPFGFADVTRRARELAVAPFDAREPTLPAPLAGLDYDAWRDIRFRPDKAFPLGGGMRLQLFHRGFLYRRPVTVNLIRGGVPTPIPYQPSLFDLGRTRLERPLPIDLGFAGLRIHAPLNRPNLLDELLVFLGASYYRFLARDQLYGLSARGLALNVEGVDGAEEFPFFREFWVTADEGADLVILALLDAPGLAGAYRFTVRPGAETRVSVELELHPRRALARVGLAPLTSMYFIGENDRHASDDYRPELHDSDGLLLAAGSGEWLWRPLENPPERRISRFADRDPKGFGLMQRDRSFESYQDLEARYERRPGYFVEPAGGWGAGSVVLVELPTDNETADNVVAYWQPAEPYQAGEPVALSYTVRALGGEPLHPGAHVAGTYLVGAAASGAGGRAAWGAARENADPLTRRFLVDFAGGELPYYAADPASVGVVASTTRGRIVATSLTPNPHVGGMRAAIDVRLDAVGDATELRAFLRAGGRTLSETWSYPWTAGRAAR